MNTYINIPTEEREARKSICMYYNSVSVSGGVERIISVLAKEWSKEYQVTILVKDDGRCFYPLPDDIQIDSVDIPLQLNMHSRWQRKLAILRSLIASKKRLNQYFESHPFDILYTATPLNALEIFILGRKCFRKTIISEHASYYAYNNNIVYRCIRKFLYPKATLLSVPTSGDAKLYQADGCRAEYIPHVSVFKALPKIPEKKKIILSVGRLTPDKQFSKLLEIWQTVCKMESDHGYTLHIVGDGEEEQNLKKQINEQGIPHVALVPRTKDITAHYFEAALFASTSRHEGFGLVMLESMAYATPCISFHVPSGAEDIIQDQVNGFLVEPFDINTYAMKILSYMHLSPVEANLYRAAALDTVNNWDNEAILAKWFSAFDIICNKRNMTATRTFGRNLM